MFFVLSKVFWFVAQPLNLAILLLILVFVALRRGRGRLAGILVSTTVLGLMLAVWTSFGAVLLTPLEQRFPRSSLPSTIDGIVVLGGGLEGQINLVRGGYELNAGGDRFVEAAVLARRYPQAKIVISGGTGTLILDGEADADTAVRVFTALGVDRGRLILENQSRNTYENAVLSKQLVKPEPGQTWLLVTSAFHMPRSMALFRRAEFDVVPWPADYRTAGDEGFSLFRDNAADSLQNTTLGLREWVGLLAYWLSGRIDTPFPGPDA